MDKIQIQPRGPANLVVLGVDIESGRPLVLSHKARQLSTYIIGKPGMGKSALLTNIVLQDIENGGGLCIIDPHVDMAETLILFIPASREKDVIFWDPTDREQPFGLNPFYCPDLRRLDSKADHFIAALASLAEFAQVFDTAPRMKDLLLHLAHTFIINQGHTLAETPRFLTNAQYRTRFYRALSQHSPQVLDYWHWYDARPEREQRELSDSSLNKLRRFQVNSTMRSIFGQQTNSINFRAAMDTGKIVIIKLSSEALGEDNAAFIGAFVVWEIFQAALSRADTPEGQRRQFHLVADEFQTFMSTAFPRLQEQARKYRVDTTIAHQSRGQLDERSRRITLTVGNKVIFGVTGHDAAELATEFKATPPEPVVTGYKPKYELASNPLEHLASHSHENPQVVSAYHALQVAIEEFFEMVVAQHNQWIAANAALGSLGELSSLNRKKVEHTLNQCLYRMMLATTEGDEEERVGEKGALTPKGSKLHELSNAVSRSAQAMYDAVLMFTPIRFQSCYSSYNTLASFLKRIHDAQDAQVLDKIVEQEWEEHFTKLEECLLELGSLRYDLDRPSHWSSEVLVSKRERSGYLNQLEKTLYDERPGGMTEYDLRTYRDGWRSTFVMYGVEKKLIAHVFDLGEKLRKQPCRVPSGQIEPVMDKPRLYSDVEAQIANELATLPRYTARCIIDEGQPSEHTISTLPVPKLGVERLGQARARAEDIKRQSQQLYGREKQAVEEAITARLSITEITKMGEDTPGADGTIDIHGTPTHSNNNPQTIPVRNGRTIVEDDEDTFREKRR